MTYQKRIARIDRIMLTYYVVSISIIAAYLIALSAPLWHPAWRVDAVTTHIQPN